jgi:hypothetical protein
LSVSVGQHVYEQLVAVWEMQWVDIVREAVVEISLPYLPIKAANVLFMDTRD